MSEQTKPTFKQSLDQKYADGFTNGFMEASKLTDDRTRQQIATTKADAQYAQRLYQDAEDRLVMAQEAANGLLDRCQKLEHENAELKHEICCLNKDLLDVQEERDITKAEYADNLEKHQARYLDDLQRQREQRETYWIDRIKRRESEKQQAKAQYALLEVAYFKMKDTFKTFLPEEADAAHDIFDPHCNCRACRQHHDRKPSPEPWEDDWLSTNIPSNQEAAPATPVKKSKRALAPDSEGY